jgi:hypothetical protein
LRLATGATDCSGAVIEASLLDRRFTIALQLLIGIKHKQKSRQP